MKISRMFLTWLLTFAFCLNCFANTAPESEESNEPSKVKIERHFVFDTIPLNLEEIIEASKEGEIFSGKCIGVEELENDPVSVVKYTFEVIEGIKGVKDNDVITFKQWKPTVRGAGYEIGKEYVLFLHPESDIGLTSPVGFEQGRFEIEKKGFIRRYEVVKNGLSNHGLNRNLKTQKAISIESDKFINDYVHRCSEQGIPMRYKEFIKAVRSLAEKGNQ